MEPKFELRFAATQKMLAEFQRKMFVPIWLLGTIFCALQVLGCTILALRDELPAEDVSMIAVFVLFGVVFCFWPDLLAWNQLRQEKKKNGGRVFETCVRIGDEIEMIEDTMRLTVSFEKVEKIVHLKHSYVLMLGKRNGVILDPDSFTKGTFAEFKQHLREKCPTLLIPE